MPKLRAPSGGEYIISIGSDKAKGSKKGTRHNGHIRICQSKMIKTNMAIMFKIN